MPKPSRIGGAITCNKEQLPTIFMPTTPENESLEGHAEKGLLTQKAQDGRAMHLNKDHKWSPWQAISARQRLISWRAIWWSFAAARRWLPRPSRLERSPSKKAPATKTAGWQGNLNKVQTWLPSSPLSLSPCHGENMHVSECYVLRMPCNREHIYSMCQYD